ncbi:YigZ family protein [Dongshaea marina]|uniref:YigZ family protein n=1 Tax=Dongshaea marina TaxID=2047966 RepID=UPI000D3E957B|nr:YigZ family protein [Dongshaea marina]
MSEQQAGYRVPLERVSCEETIKKSVFISYIQHVATIAEARAFIAEIREQHPKARHHCWAYIAGSPDDSQVLGFSDDGEPSGTAGKPILAQLQGSGLGELCAVVVRYSGGIKLGTGGLVRAYGGGIASALLQLQTQFKPYTCQVKIECGYELVSAVERLLHSHQGRVLSRDYAQAATLRIELPARDTDAVIQALTDISRGQAMIERLNT